MRSGSSWFPHFIPAIACPVCTGPVEAETFPLCSICEGGLADCPALCGSCGSPICPPSSSDGGCTRPWAGTSGVSSWFARYLLVGRGYAVLKNWKRSRGPFLSQRVLNSSSELERWLDGIRPDFVVPIPQSFARAWRLGGSPALHIAHWLRSQGRRIPTLEALSPSSHRSQARLDSIGRFTNLIRFEPSASAANLRGKRVILVDDFMTTGRTLRSAARILKEAGAPEVHVFCLGLRPTGVKRTYKSSSGL